MLFALFLLRFFGHSVPSCTGLDSNLGGKANKKAAFHEERPHADNASGYFAGFGLPLIIQTLPGLQVLAPYGFCQVAGLHRASPSAHSG